MRFWRAAIAAMVTVALTASPAWACRKDRHHDLRRARVGTIGWQDVLFGGVAKAARALARADKATTARAAAGGGQGPVDLSSYEGLGSWVDIFNHKPWDNPAGAVRTMDKRGARTIFLQTSTYGQSGGIYDKDAVGEFLDHAHRRGMKVVAWYVPSFDQQVLDLKRIEKAIRYRSDSGERFDSFALDIEATNVASIETRNRRLIRLSQRIRRVAGPGYPLGAITPDPIASLYWPEFPYKEVAELYDVFVPMGYFTFRADGYSEVREYTAANIRKIRRETGSRDVPIHFIGGIANDAGPNELKGFVHAARDKEVMGASLYDYPITSRRSWFEMRALSKKVAARRRAEALARREAAEERAREQREKEKEREERRKTRKRSDAERDDKKKSPKQQDEARKRKNAKERRNPSRSASSRDRGSSREGGRERQHRRSRDRQRRRS